MEINFGPGQTAAPAPATEKIANVHEINGVAVPSTTTIAAPAAPATPAAPTAPTTTAIARPGGSGLMLGDKLPSFKDIILPRLNIVQNIGELKESFEPGTLIFNQALPLYIPARVVGGKIERPATPLAVITVLGFLPDRFLEKVPGGARGLILNSEDEVRANGGTLDYQEWKLKEKDGMRRFEVLADAVVAIERPESIANDGTVFTHEVGGKQYALAIWGLKGVNYTAVAKRVFFTSRATGCLKAGGYPSFAYTVGTREEKYQNGNKAWVGICVPKERNSPEFIQFVRLILNDNPQPDSASEA